MLVVRVDDPVNVAFDVVARDAVGRQEERVMDPHHIVQNAMELSLLLVPHRDRRDAAAFIHRDYLDTYTSDVRLEQTRKFVHDNRNCEDIAISILASVDGGVAPIWVQDDNLIELDAESSIHNAKNHYNTRSACSRFILDEFAAAGNRVVLPHRDIFYQTVEQLNAAQARELIGGENGAYVAMPPAVVPDVNRLVPPI